MISTFIDTLKTALMSVLPSPKRGPVIALVFSTMLTFTMQAQAVDLQTDRLAAVVQVDAVVPHDARTAEGLGVKRTGTGVVIDDEGLVLTIGYVILEAIEVSVQGPGGNVMPARIVAYDHESGFGLIRTNMPIDVHPLPLGSAGDVSVMDPLLVASRVGTLQANGVYLIDRRPFAGYWEYLLEEAIFTAPPHKQFGGAALIDRQGQLVGIGSLILNSESRSGRTLPANMFIPIDDLKPILDDLLTAGRRQEAGRPWLGLYLEEYRGRIFVTRVAPDGPGQDAGMAVGDLILGIDGDIADNLAGFYRDLWAKGDAGIDIPLDVVRNDQMSPTIVESGDRYRYLRLDPTF